MTPFAFWIEVAIAALVVCLMAVLILDNPKNDRAAFALWVGFVVAGFSFGMALLTL